MTATVTTILDAATETVEEDMLPRGSEEALALRFAERHAAELRYVAKWNKWLRWDGTRWHDDDTRETYTLARKLCRMEAAQQANAPRHAKLIASAKTRAAVVSLAGEDRRLAATIEQWDTDPWLLNTPAGIYDLRTGLCSAHDPLAYQTKLTAVAPHGDCSLWMQFLNQVTAGNDELIRFLQRTCGYVLTGSTQEHAMFFLHGGGGNGKSVFLKTIAGVIGEYSRVAPIETFTASMQDRHPTELAALRGARLVIAFETEEGRQWAEARLKALTGGDKVSARFMRQDFFEYSPQFKLMIAGNHKPGLRSVDEAMKRRQNMIPFTVTIPKEQRDPTFADKLKVEWSGVLKWMIDGCRQWQTGGLAQPTVVRQATEEYLDSEDALKAWLDECCRLGSNEWVSTADLFASWKRWGDTNNEYVGKQRQFIHRLEARGFKRQRRGDGRREHGFAGLTIPL